MRYRARAWDARAHRYLKKAFHDYEAAALWAQDRALAIKKGEATAEPADLIRVWTSYRAEKERQPRKPHRTALRGMELVVDGLTAHGFLGFSGNHSSVRDALTATSKWAAIEEGLRHLGATFQEAMADVTSRKRALHWDARVAVILRGTKAQRWQAEALARIRGIGDSTSHMLCGLVGHARFDNTLKVLRGTTRMRVAEVVDILNAASADEYMAAVMKRANSRRAASL
jgi:hypothetical protein